MLFKVRFERSPQDVRQPDLERGVGLGVVLAEGDDPGRPLSDEGSFEDEIGEIAPAQWDQREEPDQETVAMGDRGVEPDEVLGRSDQFDTRDRPVRSTGADWSCRAQADGGREPSTPVC